MILAQAAVPLGRLLAHLFQHAGTHGQFDRVALAIIKADGFDAAIVLEGPGQAGGGILSTAKEHQCGVRC
ncbi:hypothetical protein D3C72_2011570 [compost metagenome]